MKFRSRATARAVVIYNNQILLMERWQGNSHYYSVPGGGIDTDETAEEATIREVYEETSIKISIKQLIYKFDLGGFTHQIFLANYISGHPKLREDSEEMARNLEGQNRYHPLWLDTSGLGGINFGYMDPVRMQLITDLKNGFDSSVKTIVSDAKI